MVALKGHTRILTLVSFCVAFIIIWQIAKLYPHINNFSNQERGLQIHTVLEDGSITAPVKISVYYEALCHDSKSFIIHQLLPTYEIASRLIEIDLIPYGKAETKQVGDTYSFECQHLYLECEANKYHACAVDLVEDVGVRIKYVACMINDNTDPEGAAKKCASQYSIDYKPIHECANGDKGTLLLKKHGDTTNALNPKASFIPTVVFDNSRDISSLAALLKGLHKELCKQFISKPKECLKVI